MERSEEEKLDDKWYEAYANHVHAIGKEWPDELTDDEERACAAYADSIIRRPRHERWSLCPRLAISS